MTEEDLVKVGVFGFVVARSKESGSIYTFTIVNGDDGADVYDQLTKSYRRNHRTFARSLRYICLLCC